MKATRNKLVEIKKGDRVYYHGDNANPECAGVVTNRSVSGIHGPVVDITLDDGREIKGIPVIIFRETYSGNGSTRFVLESAYESWAKEMKK